MELEKKLWLKDLIRKKGFRQYEVARLMGIHECLISRHIIGARDLSDKNKEKLARILNVKKEDI